MKKFTKILTLAVALLASVTAWGRISPGERVTDYSALKTGDRIFVQGKWGTTFDSATLTYNELETPHWLSTYFPAEKADSIVVSVSETVGTQACFELEETGKTREVKFADGSTETLKSFYVKSVSSGLYLNKGKTEGITYETRLYLTSEKQTEWFISKAITMTDDPENPGQKKNFAPENAALFFCFADDGQMLTLNNNYQDNGSFSERVSYFNNGTTWHEIDFATQEDNSLEAVLQDIDELYTLSYNNYGNIAQGSNPGFCDPEYAKALDAAMANSQDDSQLTTVEDAQKCYNELLAAYIGVRDKGMHPVTDGYYWFVNCQNEWNALQEGGTKVSLKVNNGNEVWWCELDTTKAEYIWKVTPLPDNKFEVKNLATSQVLNDGSNANGVFTKEGESETNTEFIPLATQGSFGIKIANTTDAASSNYFYVHCLSHGNVAVKDGHMACLWAPRPQEYSGWYMFRVSDELVKKLTPEDEAVLKAKELKALSDSLTAMSNSIVSVLKGSIEADSTAAVNVTPTLAAEQENNFADFFSNAGMSVEHGYSYGNDGQGFTALIDGKPDTWFHTTYGTQPAWSDYTDTGEGFGYETSKHNLGCKMTQAVNNVYFVWRQRSTYADAPQKFDLEASNDGTNWTTVYYDYNLYTVPAQAGSLVHVGPIALGNDYQYIRFSTAGCSRGKFFNLSCWDILTNVTYKQGSALASVGSDKLNALYTQLSQSNDALANATVDDIDYLKNQIASLHEAYNDFNSAFVDPAELKDAAAKAKAALSQFVITENTIGTYSMEADTTALHNSLAEAETKLDNGGYTKEEVKSLAKTLLDEIEALAQFIIKPDPTKWYQIQFANQEEYTEFNFGADAEKLIDRVVCVTQGFDADTEAPKLYDSADDVVYGSAWLQSVDAGDAWNVPELSYFRFIAVGDSGYAIQNKATGLYIPNLGTSVNINLSITPGIFNVVPLGNGFITLNSTSLFDGAENKNNLHFGNVGSKFYIVGYPGGMSTKSAFHMVTIEEEESIGNANMTGIRAFVAPENFTVNEGAAVYVQIGKVVKEDGTSYIAMKQAENIPAGMPMIIVPEDAESAYSITLGTEFVSTPAQTVGTQGVFVSTEIPNGSATLKKEAESGTLYWQPSSTTGLTASASSIYLNMTQFVSIPNVAEDEADLLILIKGYNPVVSIDKVKTDSDKTHTIYTIDGVKVNSQPNDLKKGLYIIDGKKVLVP